MASPGPVWIYVEGKGHGLRERARMRKWERRMGKKEVKKKVEEREGKERREGKEGEIREKEKGEGEGDEREGMGDCSGSLVCSTPSPLPQLPDSRSQFLIPLGTKTP